EAGRLAEHQRAELAVVRWWFDVCAGTTDSEREDERAGEDGARGAGPPSGACWSLDHGNLLGVAFTCGRAGARLVRPDIVRPGVAPCACTELSDPHRAHGQCVLRHFAVRA